MTWYTDMCGIMAMSLLYRLALWSMCVGGGRGALDPMDGHYRMYVISGVGHLRSDSIVPLVLLMVCCAIVGAPALYYRSFGTASTLLRVGNISSRPYY
jgi:hypothetical protein